MELIASYLQTRGTFIARQLNVKDLEFRLFQVELTPLQSKLYNQAALLVRQKGWVI